MSSTCKAREDEAPGLLTEAPETARSQPAMELILLSVVGAFASFNKTAHAHHQRVSCNKRPGQSLTTLTVISGEKYLFDEKYALSQQLVAHHKQNDTCLGGHYPFLLRTPNHSTNWLTDTSMNK